MVHLVVRDITTSVPHASNYYQLMKVGRSATALEIKRSYKKMSLELHPDKNPSATALDDFATLKNAYDVLMDMDAREVYDRFGPEKLKQKVAVIDEYKVLVEVAIFYAAWGIMTWMLTLGKHNANARQWVFTGAGRRRASSALPQARTTASPRRICYQLVGCPPRLSSPISLGSSRCRAAPRS